MSSKDASIQLKLIKSKQLLSEVDVLLANRFFITAINRLYYSCFHATKALLLTGDYIPKTHSGVVTLLNKHFVQDGMFDSAQASFFSRLMQERIDDDYSDIAIIEQEEVDEFVDPARKYVAYIEKLIENYFDKK